MRRAEPQLLDRTFAILELFDEDHREWSTTDIARASGLPTPTAHRILRSLRTHRYVHQDPTTKRFALGSEAISLGDRARASSESRSVTAPVMRRLAKETHGTTVLWCVATNRDAGVCLHRVASEDHAVLERFHTGLHAPLHAGAARKALLAFMPDHEVNTILDRQLEKLCTATITDPTALRRHLVEIRDRGWAMSREETEPGAWGVAVSIRDRGRVLASIGVAGSVEELSRTEMQRRLDLARSAADELAEAIASVAPA